MNELHTLQEVCKALGVTRRAVQGYEHAGLVAAAARNKYGYLLYGEKEQERIRKIKQFQKLEFKIKEIKELLDAPPCIVKSALEKQLVKLEEEYRGLGTSIEEAKILIRQLTDGDLAEKTGGDLR